METAKKNNQAADTTVLVLAIGPAGRWSRSARTWKAGPSDFWKSKVTRSDPVSSLSSSSTGAGPARPRHLHRGPRAQGRPGVAPVPAGELHHQVEDPRLLGLGPVPVGGGLLLGSPHGVRSSRAPS